MFGIKRICLIKIFYNKIYYKIMNNFIKEKDFLTNF